MQKQKEEYEQELATMKREKRRLDDLLTIREGEVAQMRERLREEAAKREKQEAEATARVLRVERDFQK